MLRNTISKSLLGAFINSIKKKDIEGHCALSRLLTLPENTSNAISDEFWTLDCQLLVDSFEVNKNWDDVITFALKK